MNVKKGKNLFKNAPHCLAALGAPEGPSIRADPKESEKCDSEKFRKQTIHHVWEDDKLTGSPFLPDSPLSPMSPLGPCSHQQEKDIKTEETSKNHWNFHRYDWSMKVKDEQLSSYSVVCLMWMKAAQMFHEGLPQVPNALWIPALQEVLFDPGDIRDCEGYQIHFSNKSEFKP